MSKMSFFSL